MQTVRSIILRRCAANLPEITTSWDRVDFSDTYDLIVADLREMMQEDLLTMIQEDRARTTVLAELTSEGLELARRCRDNPAGIC